MTMDTREQIIRESLKSFVNEGYEKTSISLIAERCGMTKGAVYHHFHAKKDLLVEAIELHYREHEAWLGEKLSKTPGIRESILIFFDYRGYIADSKIFQDTDTNVYRVLIDATRHFPDLKAPLVNRYKDYLSRIVTMLEEGITLGILKKNIDPEVIALELMALFEGFIVMIVMLGEDFFTEGKKEVILNNFWERIKA